eukprot:CAMPEP_0170196834 /NCGR_PEP_ID=MMETSP0040_2-20121228/64924_1 /TAXON_ID=641309 /ORGANISM="Lotharella oceanica, Strain CCMP622" /LENGTH=144 /DNA_ID=CAMNT_0010446371 /DNA_START=142 /DNA_END=573 /DNA_ORIENTATION=-
MERGSCELEDADHDLGEGDDVGDDDGVVGRHHSHIVPSICRLLRLFPLRREHPPGFPRLSRGPSALRSDWLRVRVSVYGFHLYVLHHGMSDALHRAYGTASSYTGGEFMGFGGEVPGGWGLAGWGLFGLGLGGFGLYCLIFASG